MLTYNNNLIGKWHILIDKSASKNIKTIVKYILKNILIFTCIF